MIEKLKKALKFITYDIWRINKGEVSDKRLWRYNLLKIVYLSVLKLIKDRRIQQAYALTYSTLLAVVPILAVTFAIARGFGAGELVEQELRSGFAGNRETSDAIMSFVNSYLSQANQGVFIGVFLVLLLWTVISLIGDIELTFNSIWEVNKERSLFRKLTDYLSMLFMLPLFIVLSGGTSILMSTVLNEMVGFVLLAPVSKVLIRLVPFVITSIMFTGLYLFMPNTKVKFKYALIAGVVAGCAFQAFQFLYIHSQMGVSKYNAIYGSFAALPLFLMWLQISWIICLFGVQLNYVAQNIESFDFEEDTRNISRRFRDYITLLVMSAIVNRFENNGKPYTAQELGKEYRIPIRLVKETLNTLLEIDVIHELVLDPKSEDIAYQPSIDINKLTVGMLMSRVETKGSENFKIKKNEDSNHLWEVLTECRRNWLEKSDSYLLKDLI